MTKTDDELKDALEGYSEQIQGEWDLASMVILAAFEELRKEVGNLTFQLDTHQDAYLRMLTERDRMIVELRIERDAALERERVLRDEVVKIAQLRKTKLAIGSIAVLALTIADNALAGKEAEG